VGLPYRVLVVRQVGSYPLVEVDLLVGLVLLVVGDLHEDPEVRRMVVAGFGRVASVVFRVVLHVFKSRDR